MLYVRSREPDEATCFGWAVPGALDSFSLKITMPAISGATLGTVAAHSLTGVLGVPGSQEASIKSCVSSALAKNSISRIPSGIECARPIRQKAAMARLINGELTGHSSIGSSS